jgi:hypothetical protein
MPIVRVAPPVLPHVGELPTVADADMLAAEVERSAAGDDVGVGLTVIDVP